MAKMKVNYTVSSANGEGKNEYIGLSLGRVKRMIRGKGITVSMADAPYRVSFRKDGRYIGAFYRGRKDCPSQLRTWPVDWHK